MYRVLVADDTKTERDCIKFLAGKYGLPLDIVEACNGREALALIEKERFDIIITDVIMPFIDGLELSKKTLELYDDLKIIIFSGYDEFEYAQNALRLGVSEYLLKPIEPEEFNAAIKKVIAKLPPPPADFADTINRIEAVKQFIAKNYDKDLSLDILAKEVYVHPDYLSRIFKQECGVTLNKFIKSYRMDKAIELLKGSHMKVRDIAIAVGYSNYSYFCRSFREHFGNSPERIRRSEEDAVL